jgi:hypothetical protein
LSADLSQSQQDANNSNHSGTPHPVTHLHTGHRGCPKIIINAEWLAWAVNHQSTAQIARFLGVSVHTVSKAMVDYSLRAPLEPPILQTVSETNPPTITFTQIHSYTAHVLQWTDEELDYEIQLLHHHFPNAGITMLHGHFCQMGENVPHEQIHQALNQISPASHPFCHTHLR